MTVERPPSPSPDPAFADAVIVAAGSSDRMGGRDKLDIEIGGRTVLRRAVEAMLAAPLVRRVVLVTATERVAATEALPWIASLGIQVIPGGARRQDSTAAGVRATDAPVVLVHDGARPSVRPDVVDAVARTARDHGAAIPVLPVVDSLKQVQDGVVVGTAVRESLFRAQTPQGARRDLLLGAVEALAGGDERFGDEAELLARYGVPVLTVPGDPTNLKLTTPSDVELVAAIATAGVPTARYGTGHDSHPFGAATGLRLGGIVIAAAPRLEGHSDGDVVLHAICDALLGAAGMPDLGRMAPASDASTRDIASGRLVDRVRRMLVEAGFEPASIDVTVVGARPHLGGRRLDAMRDAIAELTRLPVAHVSVKASTGNLAGDEGAGRGMSAMAIAGVVHR